MEFFVKLLGFSLLFFIVRSQKVRYDNYRVYNVLFNENQVEIMEKLQLEDFSIWMSTKDPISKTRQVDIMVKPRDDYKFNELMIQNRLEYHIKIDNVQRLIEKEAQQSHTLIVDRPFDWTSYHTLNEIYNWLDEITSKYPKIVKPFTIGHSFENRPIRGIKISFKNGNSGIFVESNIHAREWITSATATYLINELLISNRSEIRNIAENNDWYIIPVLNVDGFVYTHEKDRMWRKTRKLNANSSCIGTDGNRNFDSHWMENNGASADPCSEVYAGSYAFSESETKSLADYYKTIKNNIDLYLSFHSYGQLILSPYGHIGNEFPGNYNDMQTVAKAAADAIKLKYNTSYRYGSTASILYVASGASPDWIYNTQNTSLAYTFEFRDKGKYGFILPPNEIKPNSEEIIDGIVAMVGKSKELKK